MDDQELFARLEKQTKTALLDRLRAAFREMNARQRQAVFGSEGAEQAKPRKVARTARAAKRKPAVGAKPLAGIDQFRRDSLAGKYYAPFNVNSKNWMEIPKETNDWCDRFARFTKDAAKLTAAGRHAEAVKRFSVLWELLVAMERGDEIIFAEEVGSWLIQAEEKDWLRAYLTSLAAVSSPEEFAGAVMPMVQRDRISSNSAQVLRSALRAASPEQRDHLKAALKRGTVRSA